MTSKRSINATNETELLKKVVKIVIFARLDFSSGVQRMHTEIGPITATHPVHGAEVYTGIGDFGGIEGEVVESVSGAPQALKLRLTGIKSSWINMALTDDYYRRDAEVMIGLEDEAGDLVANPEILFSGFMDKVDVALSEGLGAMTLTCESRGTNLQRAPDNRFTDEDKQSEMLGLTSPETTDLMGEYVYRMADLKLYWGDREFNSPFSPSGPSVPADRTPPGGHPL
jgi:hypothetical protein